MLIVVWFNRSSNQTTKNKFPTLFQREFDKFYLTSPPAPLRVGDGSKKLNFSLLLTFRNGKGGWEGEVHRTQVFSMPS